ncbi:MAG: carbamoyltransferase HypF [Thermoleophilaceae bacterium]|nr:carbamoyltransferase HypF [Thermoleophilaceae bacterium]
MRARVEGTVQGVGFRPYVHRLAGEHGLAGWVLNDQRGVLLEVEGPDESVARFLDRLPREPPPLAVIETITPESIAATGEQGFEILASRHGGDPMPVVSPDVATCEECLRELFDPADRRHRYPFINCTNCGPRFTIVTGVPYDRPNTTMAGFEMCAQCRAEYENPADRRFHAQPNACARCGPVLSLVGSEGGDPLAVVSDALAGAAVVAVKGIGGFHLACRADSEEAVGELRARKRREEKPFAVMAPDLESARALVELTPAEEALLLGPERPIVVARRRPGAAVAGGVAPGEPDLGVMLPYSPLHHLLLADAGAPLVMTSGNASDEPIAFSDEDAAERLSGIADLFLMHDRPIRTRTDDSVVRSLGELRDRPLILRRSRGYVPASLRLPGGAPPLLAVGAELKSTFCLASGERAWVSHHIGDLSNYETLRSFEDGVRHFEELFAVAPELVAHDLHPEYLSTSYAHAYARAREGVELLGVQHHHAHLAGCLAEHGETGPAIGAIYDGTGYGPDATIWGGELLVGSCGSFGRAGHLAAVPMPGGEAAIREPWRMACAWLGGSDPPPDLAGERWEQIEALLASKLPMPLTTSMGRLFDAASALCGVRAEVSYEGQAAIELEAIADPSERGRYEMALEDDPDTGLVVDPRPALDELLADVRAGTDPGVVSARFHAGVAAATVAACGLLASRHGLETVVLSGGVWQNRLLVELALPALAGAGLRPLLPERLPPGDGGISYGQVAVAATSTSTRMSTTG